MPPILSDSDSDSEGGIPFRTASVTDAPAEDNAASGDDDAEEYVVESIVSHDFRKGELYFQVKWQGYDDEADLTWEPEENLETAAEVLKEYYDNIGGRPEAPSSSSKKGSKGRAKRSHNESNGTPDPASSKSRKKRGTTNGKDETATSGKKNAKAPKYPPRDSNNWDAFVDACDTIELGPISDNTHEKFALLRWDNGQLTKTSLRMAHKYAPQAMLRFYEGHLRFDNGSGAV